MINRVQHAIEQIQQRGGCPRLQIDSTHEGIVCPDFLVERWQVKLVIDLDPTWPLNLAYTDVGVEADLSFQGFVVRCTFPYRAIYVVGDRDGGQALVIDEHVPASLRPKAPLPGAPRKRTPGTSRRKRRHGAAGEATTPSEAKRPRLGLASSEASSETSTDAGADAGVAVEKTAPQKTDEAAQRRRSAFRVIDGGG